MGKIIGIDLGTTNSEAAHIEGGRPSIIPSAEGSAFGGKMFPSVVAFTKDGERLVGEPAKRQAVLNPERTITRIKRKMGTDFKVTIDDKNYTPQEISSMILQKIKADAESYLGGAIEGAVITVPAYFNDNQRQATKDAGKIAGLDVKRIINEPTAAAFAYGLDKEEEIKLVVLDLGGGTFDVTIMEIGDGVFEVLSTNGDTLLGGADMDDKIMEWIRLEFKREHGVELPKDRAILQRLRDASEKAKIELTGTVKTNISLPFLTSDASGPKHLETSLTRAKMEELIEPVISRCETPIKNAFSDAGLKYGEIDRVILVGGPTRMPIIKERFERITGKKAERGIDPMQCVAMGAAIQAGILSGDVDKEIVLLDVTPLSLGVETLGGVLTKLIERNTTIPTRKSQTFSTAADGQTSVEVHVLQGERPMATDNVTLGRFHLVGIPPAPRGIPQIEVSFDIDSSGIMNVSAKDTGTGKEQKITITASTKLSDEFINSKVEDAEKYAEEDKKKQETIEVRNNAESLIYSCERTLQELGDKVPEDVKKEVNEKAEELKKTLEGEDIPKIKADTETLSTTLQKVGAAIYEQGAQDQAQQQTGQAPPPGGEPTGQPVDDANVVDADYTVEENDK